MTKGWKFESGRHSMSARGLKSGKKNNNKPPTKPKKTMEDIKSDISQFIGTQQYHQGWAGVKWTDGVAHFFQKHAGWLITDISSYNVEPKVRKMEFQVWTITIKPDKSAILKLTDGNTEKAIKTQTYKYADLPEGKLTFYLQNGVLMLPSEY